MDKKSGDQQNNDMMNESIELLNNIKINTSSAIECANNLLSQLKDNQLSTESGISFLSLKNQVLMSYLMDLSFMMFTKLNGEQLEGSDVIKRLVENRTVLEKMRPIEHKLKYKIDQLIKSCSQQHIDINDPLRLKPKLDNIMSNENANEECGDEDNYEDGIDTDKASKKPKTDHKYIPPKISAVPYDLEENRKLKAFERAKKRALSSSIIQELRQEFDDAPQEIIDTTHFAKKKVSKLMNERTVYEEEYLTRMNLTKKQRNEAKQMSSMTSMANGITNFEDISALDTDLNEFSLPSKKKRPSKHGKAKKFNRKKFTKLRK